MTQDLALRVVPRRSLLVTAFVSIVVVMAPASGVLYWFAVPRGQGLTIAVIQVALILGAVGMLVRQLTVDTVVAAGELRGRGIFSPLVRVPLDRIATVDLVPVYIGPSHESVLQLLVRDAEGRRLYRMRGTFWHPGDLERVAEALPVPTTVAVAPISRSEFYRAYPGSAYWFENRPWLVAVLVALVAAACVAIGVAFMLLFDMPVMG